MTSVPDQIRLRIFSGTSDWNKRAGANLPANLIRRHWLEASDSQI